MNTVLLWKIIQILQRWVEDEEEKRRFNPKTEIQLTDAKEIKSDAKIDDEIITKLELPAAYGRMAAQTAKQVIIQKLREAERINLFKNFMFSPFVSFNIKS